MGAHMTIARLALKCLMLTSALTIAAMPVSAGGMPNAGDGATHAYFGDLHLHTAWSFDAFIFKTTATPDDAYKFAKGAPLRHPAGGIYQLKHPLDFLAVTDHSEFMGVLKSMGDAESPMSKLPIAKKVMDPDFAVSGDAFYEILAARRAGRMETVLGEPKAWAGVVTDAWGKMVEYANANYEPGKFTTFIGYEFTSAPDGKNLHRNVIFRGDTAPQPFTTLDSPDPENLWAFLDNQRRQGIQALVIPHNSNASDGAMFGTTDFKGNPITPDYARRRAFHEPLVEVTQVKGQSETHPSLSPNDEFANFELLENYIAAAKPITKFAGGYVRDALRTGLLIYEAEGVNPYKFGMVAASDTHTGIIPAEESNYSGKVGVADGTPEARLNCTYCRGSDYRKFGSAGLAGVWARANTREDLFDAMARRETFGTTGPRIQVRMFAGYDLAGVVPGKKGWVDAAYRRAVPMGGDLPHATGDLRPTFLLWAIKDPDSANLDRIQVVKVWTKSGQSFEKIFDVALSDGRKVDVKTGKAPAVGNTVDVALATYKNSIGATSLTAVWTDPEFDPGLNAAYYGRVIEIPTPRWSTYDAMRLKRAVPEGMQKIIQERAYTSPIWYDVTPNP